MVIAKVASIINWSPMHCNFELVPQSKDEVIYFRTSVSSTVVRFLFSFSGAYIGLLILFFRAWSLCILKCQNYDQIPEGDDLTHMLFSQNESPFHQQPYQSYCVITIIWDFFFLLKIVNLLHAIHTFFLPKKVNK